MYLPASGDTVLLDDIAFTGFAAIREAPRTRDELCLALAALAGAKQNEPPRGYVDELVRRLRDMGVIESA